MSCAAGLVYRSGVLDALDDDEVARLAGLGIRTVIDLRSDDEVEARPNRLPHGVDTVRASATDVSASPRRIMELIEAGEVDDLGPSMLVQGNTAFATTYRAMFATIVRALCDAERQPVIVQCTAGKDRTGFAVATMLWALGVDHDTVVEDYLRSNELLAERHGRLLDDARRAGSRRRRSKRCSCCAVNTSTRDTPPRATRSARSTAGCATVSASPPKSGRSGRRRCC